MPKTKVCIKCNKAKTLNKFYKDNSKKDGFNGSCKECVKSRTNMYYHENIEKAKKARKQYRDKNKEKKALVDKIYSQNNKEKIANYNKGYQIKNKERISNNQKIYREKNKEKLRKDKSLYNTKNREKINEKKKVYNARRCKTDPTYKLSGLLRHRILMSIKSKSGRKSLKTEELLGCTIKEVRTHLEKQFTEGMSWDTHGVKGWHIDHIIPCASFDLTDIEQQKKCFHYTNLQPLWWIDNIKKGAKIV